MSTVTGHERVPLWIAFRNQSFNGVRFAQTLLVIGALGLWELMGRRLGSFLMAPPSSLPGAAQQLWATSELQLAVLDSLKSLFVGFGIAAALGITVGFLMGWHEGTRKTLHPFVSAGYVTPISALVPVIIIWFGLGITSRLVVIALFAVFEITISTEAGVQHVDRGIVDVARAFGASQTQMFRTVVFFAAMPYIFAGLRMGMSKAINGMVVAELLFAVTGMGGAVRDAANHYRTDYVFIYVIIVVLLGVVLVGAVRAMERWIVPWRQ